MNVKRSVVAAVAALAVVLAGCGQSPTSDKAGGGGGGTDSGARSALEKVYKQLEGLEGEARFKKLTELAAEEDEKVGLYTSMNLEDSTPLTEDFTEKLGVDVDLYRASSSDVLQRVLEESKAGFPGADVVALNGPEMQILDNEGLLLPLETPTRADIYENAQYDNWLGLYLNTFAAGWNTDRIKQSQAPKTWEEVLTKYPGQLSMEVGDWDWFATLTQNYFVKKKGMTKDEAVDMFRQAAEKATMVDGHTTMAELLAAGEYGVSSSVYQHTMVQMVHEGAPVAWEPAVEPIMLRPNGIGIYRDTEAPATALLFTEYGLTDGQKVIGDLYRTPANTQYGGDNGLTALQSKYDTVDADLGYLLKTRAKWEKLYEDVASESGGEVIEGE